MFRINILNLKNFLLNFLRKLAPTNSRYHKNNVNLLEKNQTFKGRFQINMSRILNLIFLTTAYFFFVYLKSEVLQPRIENFIGVDSLNCEGKGSNQKEPSWYNFAHYFKPEPKLSNNNTPASNTPASNVPASNVPASTNKNIQANNNFFSRSNLFAARRRPNPFLVPENEIEEDSTDDDNEFNEENFLPKSDNISGLPKSTVNFDLTKKDLIKKFMARRSNIIIDQYDYVSETHIRKGGSGGYQYVPTFQKTPFESKIVYPEWVWHADFEDGVDLTDEGDTYEERYKIGMCRWFGSPIGEFRYNVAERARRIFESPDFIMRSTLKKLPYDLSQEAYFSRFYDRLNFLKKFKNYSYDNQYISEKNGLITSAYLNFFRLNNLEFLLENDLVDRKRLRRFDLIWKIDPDKKFFFGSRAKKSSSFFFPKTRISPAYPDLYRGDSGAALAFSDNFLNLGYGKNYFRWDVINPISTNFKNKISYYYFNDRLTDISMVYERMNFKRLNSGDASFNNVYALTKPHLVSTPILWSRFNWYPYEGYIRNIWYYVKQSSFVDFWNESFSKLKRNYWTDLFETFETTDDVYDDDYDNADWWVEPRGRRRRRFRGKLMVRTADEASTDIVSRKLELKYARALLRNEFDTIFWNPIHVGYFEGAETAPLPGLIDVITTPGNNLKPDGSEHRFGFDTSKVDLKVIDLANDAKPPFEPETFSESIVTYKQLLSARSNFYETEYKSRLEHINSFCQPGSKIFDNPPGPKKLLENNQKKLRENYKGKIRCVRSPFHARNYFLFDIVHPYFSRYRKKYYSFWKDRAQFRYWGKRFEKWYYLDFLPNFYYVYIHPLVSWISNSYFFSYIYNKYNSIFPQWFSWMLDWNIFLIQFGFFWALTAWFTFLFLLDLVIQKGLISCATLYYINLFSIYCYFSVFPLFNLLSDFNKSDYERNSFGDWVIEIATFIPIIIFGVPYGVVFFTINPGFVFGPMVESSLFLVI